MVMVIVMVIVMVMVIMISTKGYKRVNTFKWLC